MIGIKVLIEKLNTAINSGTLTDLQLAQAFGAIQSLENNSVDSVATSAQLPDVVNNKGRIFWIENENRYVLSNGVSWSRNNILDSGNRLYSWGSNSFGALGDGTTTAKSSPVVVLGGFTDWTSATAGNSHGLGVRANGTLWAWGNNGSGRLGNSSTVSSTSPVSVVGGILDWVSASAGSDHSLGLRATGQLYAWGSNTFGRLGDGSLTTESKSSPVLVAGGITEWIDCFAGGEHSLALRANGVLYGWGLNNFGQCGDTTAANKSSPTIVAGGIADWTGAAAGYYHSLGIRATGQLYAWGRNNYVQLGDTTTVNKGSPTIVVGGITEWTSVGAGDYHSLAVRANGVLYAWGRNISGQLGDGTTANKSSPTIVSGGFTDWVSASGGNLSSNGLRANGTAYAWGQGSALGDGTTASKSVPVLIAGGFTDWVSINAQAQAIFSVGIRG